jgi:dTDP-4-amino-4,6-dideoxygalactose transaminase
MNRRTMALAATGGVPEFAAKVPVTRNRLPDWSAVERAVDGIWERRYFANHGPLVQELDQEFASHLGVAHSICVANRTLGFMVAVRAMELKGEVIVPAISPRHLVPALRWAGLKPRYCDIESGVAPGVPHLQGGMLSGNVVAVAMPHFLGPDRGVDVLEELTRRNRIALLFDATSALGGYWRRRPVGSFGTAEVFSFNQDAILNAGEGGCITTSDGGLAARMRAIRHFFPVEVQVPLRLNAKMSEIQAALALAGLSSMNTLIAANRERYDEYARGLSGISGVTLLGPPGSDPRNFQDICVRINDADFGLSRDELRLVLDAHNIETKVPYELAEEVRGAREVLYPNAAKVSRNCLQLPNPHTLRRDDVTKICGVIARAAAAASVISSGLRDP